MADYTDLATLKARLWPTGSTSTDTSEDDIMTAVITAASRLIENYCGRSFTTSDTTSARYYTAEDPEMLFVDDLVSVTTINTDNDGDRTYEDTWGDTDFDLLPDNAAVGGWPYTFIQITPLGAYSFPLTRKGVKITATWGWSAVPGAITEACLLQSERLFKRKDAPFGIVNNPAGGDMRLLNKLDPDVEMLISPYRRLR